MKKELEAPDLNRGRMSQPLNPLKKTLEAIRISAVITTRNEEEYIAQCLESLLNQTVRPDELILIDAQSKDRTLEIAYQYPIDRFYQVTFQNIYRSKRLGILMAESDIILCIDGDSTISPDFIERGLNFIKNGYDVVSGYVKPHKTNALTNLIAGVCNRNPLYISGPAYILSRERFIQTCRIKEVDGLADVCELSKEVPLQKFQKTKKCPEMLVTTDLPSTGQKNTLILIGAIATTVPTYFAYRAYRKV